MIRPRAKYRTAPRFGRYLGALAAQLLHACSDHRKVVSSAGSGALAAQLLHACPDHGKIVGGTGSGHVSSVSCSRAWLCQSALYSAWAPEEAEATPAKPEGLLPGSPPRWLSMLDQESDPSPRSP